MKEVISLGSMCWTRWLIMPYQTNQETLPFDWLDSKSIKNIHKVIVDLLNDRLNVEQFVTLDEKSCNLYDLWFGHYNPPPKNQKDSNLEVFTRRLNRFKMQYLNPEIKKLFVYYNRQTDKEINYTDILNTAEDILKNAKGAGNQLLLINHSKNTHISDYENDDVTAFDLDFYSLQHDENNCKTSIKYEEHFVPACKRSNVLNFISRFIKV